MASSDSPTMKKGELQGCSALSTLQMASSDSHTVKKDELQGCSALVFSPFPVDVV